MPLSKYDRYFGGKPGSAAKAKAAMKDEALFYMLKNKRKAAMKGKK